MQQLSSCNDPEQLQVPAQRTTFDTAQAIPVKVDDAIGLSQTGRARALAERL
jgi:hypothetical protein